jgi:hypothetical protein
MAIYALTKTNVILRDGNAWIPPDPGNAEYQRYLKWVAEGNTPDPVPPPTPEEIAAAAQAAQDKADAQEVRADLKFQALISKTPQLGEE